VAAVVLGVLAAVTVVVNSQTEDVVLIAYWYFGAGVISFCLLALAIGRRFTRNPIAPAASSASFRRTTSAPQAR
jgi:hypothetical protein